VAKSLSDHSNEVHLGIAVVEARFGGVRAEPHAHPQIGIFSRHIPESLQRQERKGDIIQIQSLSIGWGSLQPEWRTCRQTAFLYLSQPLSKTGGFS
jgi:hypothetical protein